MTENVNGPWTLENQAEMNSEIHRLTTFLGWPMNAGGFPTQLARAGFFYSGHGDEVTCFCCGINVSGWQFSLVPWEIHAWRSPFCRFVLGVEDTNMPLRPTTLMHSGLMNNFGADANSINTQNDGQSTTCSSVESVSVSSVNEACGHCITSREVERQFQERAGLNDADEAKDFRAVEKGDGNNNLGFKEHRGEPELEGGQPKQGHDPGAGFDICVEKEDELYEELIRENRRLKHELMCKICHDEDVSILFLPCGHLSTCLECACLLRENTCPICKEVILGTIRVYLA